MILAVANRDAQRLRGEGDAQAARIYADAYGTDREFYRLYRSLQAYQATFRQKSDVLLLQPDSDFFRYFNAARPRVEGK